MAFFYTLVCVYEPLLCKLFSTWNLPVIMPWSCRPLVDEQAFTNRALQGYNPYWGPTMSLQTLTDIHSLWSDTDAIVVGHHGCSVVLGLVETVDGHVQHVPTGRHEEGTLHVERLGGAVLPEDHRVVVRLSLHTLTVRLVECQYQQLLCRAISCRYWHWVNKHNKWTCARYLIQIHQPYAV